jgi:hypothetical protein
MPALDVKLMTKDQDLSFQEARDRNDNTSNDQIRLQALSHSAEALRDSVSRTSRIKFRQGQACNHSTGLLQLG